MARVTLTACFELAGACAVNASVAASCSHSDDWSSFFRRRDAAPALTFINAFLSYVLSTVDAGEHRVFAALLTFVNVVAGMFSWAILTEASVVVSALLGFPSLALRGFWASADPVVATLPLVFAGALAGALFVAAARAPALFTIDPCTVPWRNARTAAQAVLVLVCSLYYAQTPTGYDEVAHYAWRPEWVAYAAAKTLALLAVYVVCRADTPWREAVYGPSLGDYDAAWARLLAVYALLLATCAYMWAVAWRVVAAQLGVAALCAAALAVWRRGAAPPSVYGRLVCCDAQDTLKEW